MNALPGLGRSFSDKDVASFLGVDVRLVRRFAHFLGGIRLGKKYIFFEEALVNAIQRQIGSMDRPGSNQWFEEKASLQDQKRGFGVGRATKERAVSIVDRHSIIT